jgi:hypothetical protein
MKVTIVDESSSKEATGARVSMHAEPRSREFQRWAGCFRVLSLSKDSPVSRLAIMAFQNRV